MTTAIEKSWPAVAPQLLTADGSSHGVVQVADSRGFKVKQKVVLVATGLPNLEVKIMRFLSPTSFYVGPLNPTAGQGLTGRADLSAYTMLLGAYVYAGEQPKVTIKPEDIFQAIYRQEPGTTIGVEIDDQWGNPIDTVTGSDGMNRLAVDAEVNVEVNSIALFTKPYDAIVASYPSPTQETYQSKVGGIAGTNVQLVTVNYTDSSKNLIANAFRIDN